MSVDFKGSGNETEVIISFDPESSQSSEKQAQGWQGIADNYKAYVTKMEK